jgi:DNA-binding response OmpR family regulator
VRILVIDDETYVREALERVLKSPSITVIGAADAAAGFTAMRVAAVDLVIIDVILPGMDGVTAIKRLRREYPDVRIIAMSGGGNFGLAAYRPEAISTGAYLAACSAAGANGTLAKPFETAELRSLMNKCLGESEGAQRT